MVRRLLKGVILAWYVRKGLQISEDCRLIGVPDFGSEPYLVSIGRHVTISSNVTFITHDGGTWVFRDRPEYSHVIKYGRIVLFENCFIGHGVTIMPGVSVGPNSVVAACSVVTKNVPPYTVVGGIPARVIMTVEEYANKCLRNNVQYDPLAYRIDKKHELLRILPRPW